MKAARLLALYERMAGAPDAVARLRRFVLDLAVRGKLVPQDARDEPASELLKRISSRRTAPSDVEHGLELAAGWERTTLGIVANIVMGQSPPGETYNKEGSGAPLINGPVEFTAGPFGKTTLNQYTTAPTNFCNEGDLLICVRGSTTGRTNIAAFRACLGRGVAAIQPRIDGAFLRLFVWSSRETIIQMGRGIAFPSVSRKQLEELPFPLPPLAEQHRIVAKVDELMALCDRLEAARTEREATRDRLAAASLARLNTPDPETFPADARFALDSLSTLTTRPDQIKHLRRTILNLAVRGKLVPQDERDETASAGLERLTQKRRNRREFADVETSEREMPELPGNWIWTSIDKISADEDNAISDGPFGSQLKTEHYIPAAGFRVIRLQNIGERNFKAEHRSYVDQPRFERLKKHHVMPGDLVVAGLVDPRVRCCEVPDDIGPALVKADCYRFAVHPTILSRFALLYLNSPLCQDFAEVHHHGMTLTRIGLGNFRRLPFPLPPAAEQHRIVAKVNKLMAICDALETSLTAATTARTRLLEATLAEAPAPAEPRALEPA